MLESRGLPAGANWTESHVTRISATPPALTSQQSLLFDRVEQGRIEIGQPHRTSADAGSHAGGVSRRAIHAQQFGPVGFRGSSTTDTLDQTFSAKWITDVNVSYTFMRHSA